jgi:hypothetical protein
MRQFWCVTLIAMFVVVTGDRGWSSEESTGALSSLTVCGRAIDRATEIEAAELQSRSSELPEGDEARPGLSVGLAVNPSVPPLPETRCRERSRRSRSVQPATLQAEQVRLQI